LWTAFVQCFPAHYELPTPRTLAHTLALVDRGACDIRTIASGGGVNVGDDGTRAQLCAATNLATTAHQGGVVIALYCCMWHVVSELVAPSATMSAAAPAGSAAETRRSLLLAASALVASASRALGIHTSVVATVLTAVVLDLAAVVPESRDALLRLCMTLLSGSELPPTLVSRGSGDVSGSDDVQQPVKRLLALIG
jgi:hypothetical protein